jgi:hypothetical protein
MPPSGYTAQEVRSLRDFLYSCSQQLALESAASGRSLEGGLRREIQHISGVLPVSPAFARAVLELTRGFYEAVLTSLVRTKSYDDSVQQVLNKFDDEILSIHVPP